MHRAHGVRFELGVGVDDFLGKDSIEAVRLDDTRLIEADIVIAGIGVIPNVEWLESSGLELANGVVCDATCTAAENLVAAGDVARWIVDVTDRFVSSIGTTQSRKVKLRPQP